MEQQETHGISVIWRKEKFIVDVNPSITLKELGNKLQELTRVKADTLRLLVPTNANSKLLYPFSEEHSCQSLEETSLLQAKSIRMMGVSTEEVNEILKNEKVDLRIAGFDEEEKRLKHRMLDGRNALPKLPQGTYIFSDFRTLSIPGVQLNPPASEALKLLHMLASDPGIVAIMNKHRWPVGLLTEMAPVGYVGVSPKCILGVNKNHGEEISLRLRTDDLKGFRKYESIKKTLLHELAHMVYSEHDANFYALDKQLNNEAANLDWTKSSSHTLSRVRNSQQYGEDPVTDNNNNNNNGVTSKKLGGQASIIQDARASSVAAAYKRLAITTLPSKSSEESINVSDDGDNNGDGAMEIESVEEKTDIADQVNQEDSKVHFLDKATIEPMEPELNKFENSEKTDPTDSIAPESMESFGYVNTATDEMGPPRSDSNDIVVADLELQRIQDPVTDICRRMQNAIEILRHEVEPSGGIMALKTLFRIICNVIEHPDEMKFKKLRKSNATIQRNIISYKAAMDILTLTGFCEERAVDELGKVETFLVLKRNDLGLLWLAKSSVEANIG